MRNLNQEKVITLIYWGKRGGGAKMFIDTANQLIADNSFKKMYFSARPDILNRVNRRDELNPAIKLEFRPKLPSFFALIPGISKLYVRGLMKEIPVSSNSIYLVVMSSPWDSAMKLDSGINLYRVIHDANPHPGDYWPTKKTISKLTSTSKVITLSDFVSGHLSVRSVKSSLAGPTYGPNPSKTPGDYLLLIGRLKQYKNLEKTIQVLKQASDLRILVAGEGSSRYKQTGVETIDRWLSDEEFGSLINHAFATVCTYEEASQSGIVEESMRWQTPVIVKNVGGLSEQVRTLQDGYLINSLSINEFKKALTEVSKIDRSRIGLNRQDQSLARTARDLI